MTWIWFAAGAGFAQSPATPPIDILEITVWGKLALEQAEDDIVREMERLGFEARRKGDKVVFRPPRAWIGAAVLEEGELSFRRPVAGFQPTPKSQYEFDPARQPTATDPSGQAIDLRQGGPSLWILPAPKKLRTVRAPVREQLADELAWYEAVRARTNLEERILALPEQLDRMWQQGEPLAAYEPEAELNTMDQRRAHALGYWASRADNGEGRRMARAIGAWMSDRVQMSAHPITDEERTRFEALRADDLQLPDSERAPE